MMPLQSHQFLHRRTHSSIWVVVLAILSASLATDALADSYSHALAKPRSPTARAHLERGNRLYVVREFAKAIEEYKAGSLVEDAPIFQYNIAQAYRLSGHHKEAIWFYERFEIQGKPQGELREAVRKFKDEAQAKINEPQSSNVASEPASTPTGKAASATFEPSPNRRRTSPHWYSDTAGWAVIAGGVALAASAGYMFLAARELESDALLEARDKERLLMQNRASTKRLAGGILTGAAVLAIGAGSVRLALVPTASSEGSVAIAISGVY